MLYPRNGSLWYGFRWTLRHADGTSENFRIRQSARTHNRKEAQAAEDEHRRAIRRGEIHPSDPWPKPKAAAPAVVSFRSFAIKEFLPHITAHRRVGTVTFYQTCLNRILTFAAIADAPLDQITGATISLYAQYRLATPKNSVVTVNGDLRTLRRVFSLAEEWRRLDRAPAIHELTQPNGRTRVISFAEEQVYLAKATKNLRDATILAVDLGPRPDSELLTLKWADVDLKPSAGCSNGVAHIRFEGVDGKSDAAPRSVPLTVRAAEVLQRRRKIAGGTRSVSQYVFPGVGMTGHIVSLQGVHDQAVEASGLKPFPFYTWRHTFGTRAAQSGMDKFTLARLMGHSSPSITEKYYIHCTQQHMSAGFEKFIAYTEHHIAEGLKEAFPRSSDVVQ